MTTFCIKLADIPIQVTGQYETTREFCREYLTDEPADFSVEITEEDILTEREFGKQQDVRDGISIRWLSGEYLETVALYRKLAKPLLERNCLIIHGAAVVVDGVVYLFTAKSGTGKTTHAKLWLENIENSYIINGDKPLIKIEDGGIILYGTLWQGKEGYGVNEKAPLRAICVLERNTENRIERISAIDAFPKLYQQTFHFDGIEEMEHTMELLSELANNVELYRLGCNMLDDAALVAYHAMSGKGRCCLQDDPVNIHLK